MTMSEQWMPGIKLALTLQEFEQLPRNPSYKYEYLDGKAHLSPRPKHYHAVLDLHAIPEDNGPDLRPLRVNEILELVPLFADVFRTIQPFGGLSEDMRREAARQALERTQIGGDGPWISQASFVAQENQQIVGAILITLLPEGDLVDWESYRWLEPPPPDCIDRHIGRPHLTWIFVSPWSAGQGVGTALLDRSANALVKLGYRQLLTTFMVGNDSSMLWHWRNGFRLLSCPRSFRQIPKPKLKRN
jgi:ribosomal protein S18 acetylase RimI-like enzyme